MLYILCFLIIVCGILSFLYINLRLNISSLRKQLVHMREENSDFHFFSSSNSKDIQCIANEFINLKQKFLDDHIHYMGSDQYIRDMITSISHDIRTPLTSIEGYFEMLKTSETKEEQDRYYNIILTRLKDLESLLDEFFYFTKLMSQNKSLVMEKLQPYPILCTALLSFYEELKEKNITPQILCDDKMMWVMLHEESFQRICMNLIMNVVRYGKDELTITLNNKHEHIALCFRNKVSKNISFDIDRLFDRFYKGDTSRNHVGSGLGLSIVKELCERMHIDIQASLQNDDLAITLSIPKSINHS